MRRIFLCFVSAGTWYKGLAMVSFSAIAVSTAVSQAVLQCDQFTGADTGTKISNCIAALPSSGGIADARNFGNAGTNTISLQLTVGTSTKPVQLLINPTTVFTVKVAGNVCAIPISNGSSVIAAGAGGNGSNGGTFQIDGTAHISSVFCNSPQDGTTEWFWLEGVTIRGNSGATITQGLISLSGIFTNSGIRNVYTELCYAPSALYLTAPSGGTINVTSDIVFDNDNFDCTGQSTGPVVNIATPSASALGNVAFRSSPIQHAGPNQKLLQITGTGGSGTSQCANIHFSDEGFETYPNGGGSSTPVTIADCADVILDNVTISGTVPVGSNSFFTLSETQSGNLSNFRIRNVHMLTGSGSAQWTHVVNNTIDHTTHNGTVYIQGGGVQELGEYTFRSPNN